jgi:ribonuclease III
MSAALQAAIGHGFSDPGLLNRALTHASADSGRSNERLEVLGDRVLGLLIAEELARRFPDAAEGELAARLNRLVRMETCAEVALAIGIDKALILAAGERQTGGAKKAAILGDACEAVIAALYLDGGLEAARGFVLRAWAGHLDSAPAEIRDAKTLLQEWAQARTEHGRTLPHYEVLSQSGPSHAPLFRMRVTVAGGQSAEAEGRSKREAEQAAASALLEKLR